MFVSLCDELVLLSYWKIGLQFDKNSCRSISRHVYTSSFFFFFVSIATSEAF